MTRKKIYVMRCGLEIFLQAVFFFSLIVTPYFGMLNMPMQAAWKPMYIILAVAAAYLIRRRVKKLFVFLGLHALLVAGAAVFGGTESESFFLVLLTVIVSIFSFVQKNKRREERPEAMNIAFASVFLVEYFLAYGMECRIVMEFSVWLAVLYVVGQIFYVNFGRLDEIYRDNQETCNFPAKRLFGTNMFFMAATGMMVFAGMMLFYNSPFGNVLVLAKNGLFRLLGLVLGWLFRDRGGVEPDIYVEPDQELETMEIQGGFEGDAAGILQDIINTTIIITGIILCIACIVGIVIAVRRWFYRLSQVQGGENDVIEALDEAGQAAKRALPEREEEISDRDLNMRARKIYKKHIRAQKKRRGLPAPAELPAEITRRFAREEEAGEITRIYEKARYSSEKVSREEVRAIAKPRAKQQK